MISIYLVLVFLLSFFNSMHGVQMLVSESNANDPSKI